jgi:hypothetical protein
MRVTLEDQAKPSFAALCGTIGVTVEIYTAAGQRLGSSRLVPAPLKLHDGTIVWFGECGPAG